jgi:RHS repeat-associated protein
VDEPLVAYLVTGTGTSRLWYQADERGSITRLSNDSGTPGGIGKYDEYGVGGTGRIRYAGQYWLADGNLIYSRARIYDARLGRFLQPDPIGYGGGMNICLCRRGPGEFHRSIGPLRKGLPQGCRHRHPYRSVCCGWIKRPGRNCQRLQPRFIACFRRRRRWPIRVSLRPGNRRACNFEREYNHHHCQRAWSVDQHGFICKPSDTFKCLDDP